MKILIKAYWCDPKLLLYFNAQNFVHSIEELDKCNDIVDNNDLHRDLPPGQGGADVGWVEELKKGQNRLNDRELKIVKWEIIIIHIMVLAIIHLHPDGALRK